MSEIQLSNNSTNDMALAQRAELDTQISTAKAYPRSAKNVFENSLATATLNPEIAESCTYSVPRDGKNINGESIRLAEIIAGEWGNLHFGTRVVGVQNKHIVAEAVVWDLEKNNKVVVQESRRITYKNGGLYGDDMIQTTGKAAAAIALRNAIFKVVPRSFTLAIMDKVREYISTIQNPEERIKKALSAFANKKVPNDALLKILGKEKVEDLDGADLFHIIGMWNALRDGVITVDEILNPPVDDVCQETGEVISKSESILDKINKAKQAQG